MNTTISRLIVRLILSDTNTTVRFLPQLVSKSYSMLCECMPPAHTAVAVDFGHWDIQDLSS